MSLDFGSLWKEFAPQIYFILAFAGVVVALVALITRGVGAAIGALAAVIAIAGLITILNNLEAIGTWISQKIIKTGMIMPYNFTSISLKEIIRGVFLGI